MHLLLLEDEPLLGATLREKLVQIFDQVSWEKTFLGACQCLERQPRIDLAILDICLPDGSGLEFSKKLRKQTPPIPFLILSALHEPIQRMEAFEWGAEDYIPKPFHWKELLLRVQNALNRLKHLKDLQRVVQNSEGGILSEVALGKAKIFFDRFEIQTPQGRVHPLSQKEVLILKLFYQNRGRVLTRDQILDFAWSEEEFPTARTVDNFIVKLRRCLEENPDQPRWIRSVRGVGYQLMEGV